VYRLPFIRHSSTKLADEDKLLIAMLEGERNITAKSWYNGFKNVNLNPDHTQPIEVWLSTINEQLEASGATDRFLESGYNPTFDEVELESNIQLLRAIKIPPKFAALPHSAKQKVCPADALVVSLVMPSYAYALSNLAGHGNVPSQRWPHRVGGGIVISRNCGRPRRRES
jgi:hypothetical protein